MGHQQPGCKSRLELVGAQHCSLTDLVLASGSFQHPKLSLCVMFSPELQSLFKVLRMLQGGTEAEEGMGSSTSVMLSTHTGCGRKYSSNNYFASRTERLLSSWKILQNIFPTVEQEIACALFTALIRPGGKKAGRRFPHISSQVPKVKTDFHGRKVASVTALAAPHKQKPDFILQ